MNASTCTLCGVELHRLTRSGRCRRHSSTASQQNVARLQVLAWAAKVPRLRERERRVRRMLPCTATELRHAFPSVYDGPDRASRHAARQKLYRDMRAIGAVCDGHLWRLPGQLVIEGGTVDFGEFRRLG